MYTGMFSALVFLLPLVHVVAENGAVVQLAHHRFCASCNPSWMPVPTEESNAVTLQVVRADPLDGGCLEGATAADVYNGLSFAGKAVVFHRGNCTFSEMAAVVQEYGGIALFVINFPEQALFGPGAVNVSNYDDFTHPVCMIQASDAGFMTNGATFQLYETLYAPFDASALGFLFLALLAILLGSFLGTEKERRRAFGPQRAMNSQAAPPPPPEGEEEPNQELTTRKILFFVVFASTFLVIMYFLFDYIVYLLIGVFVLIGGLSVYELCCEAISRTALWKPRVDLPRCANTPIVSIFILVFSMLIGILWAVSRNDSWSWVLQDVMGVAVLTTIVRFVAVPNMKLATLLLVLLLLYDVFFVFITPLFTKNNDSVMVHAATGTATRQDTDGCVKPKEMMPFLLRMPRLSTPLCKCARESMLGFGDVVFPGWIVALCLRVDCYRGLESRNSDSPNKGKYTFTIIGAIAYTVGLVCAFAAAGLMESAQPALLYLTPSTLIAVWAAGWYFGLIPVLKDVNGALKRQMGLPQVNPSTNSSSNASRKANVASRRRTREGESGVALLSSQGQEDV